MDCCPRMSKKLWSGSSGRRSRVCCCTLVSCWVQAMQMLHCRSRHLSCCPGISTCPAHECLSRQGVAGRPVPVYPHLACTGLLLHQLQEQMCNWESLNVNTPLRSSGLTKLMPRRLSAPQIPAWTLLGLCCRYGWGYLVSLHCVHTRQDNIQVLWVLSKSRLSCRPQKESSLHAFWSSCKVAINWGLVIDREVVPKVRECVMLVVRGGIRPAVRWHTWPADLHRSQAANPASQ